MHAIRTASAALALATLGACLGACQTSPSEPQTSTGQPPSQTTPPVPTQASATQTSAATPASNPFKLATDRSGSGDPLGGKWTLADATKDIHGSGALLATLDTNHGKVSCKLYEDKAPVTVANFVGLATGKRTWKNPSGQWVNTPAYDGTTFHRIIKGFMIQGGDAAGSGAGEPGSTIQDEMWPGATHNKEGLLCMANRGANTNGAQFFITESTGGSVANLDNLHSYTVFGECAPMDVVHEIANVPTGAMNRPNAPVTINKVTVAREKPSK
jgi:peptidyl-prolyl cis-trans isomerase A (cyclophilin A)